MEKGSITYSYYSIISISTFLKVFSLVHKSPTGVIILIQLGEGVQMLVSFGNGHVPIARESGVQHADGGVRKVRDIPIAHRLVLEQAQRLGRLRRDAVDVYDYLREPQRLDAVGAALPVGIRHYQAQYRVKARIRVLWFVVAVELP